MKGNYLKQQSEWWGGGYFINFLYSYQVSQTSNNNQVKITKLYLLIYTNYKNQQADLFKLKAGSTHNQTQRFSNLSSSKPDI